MKTIGTLNMALVIGFDELDFGDGPVIHFNAGLKRWIHCRSY